MDGMAGFILIIMVIFSICAVIGVISGIIDIYNFMTNESTVTTEIIEATISHLDIAISSPTDKPQYYLSIICENDEEIVIEINESDYVIYNVGDKVTIQKEIIKNTKLNDEIVYTVINDTTNTENLTIGGNIK